MCRHDRGVPRSDIRNSTWWYDSGESDQKSHWASLDRVCVSGIRFWEWMKSWNLDGSRTKKIGVLLPTRS